jgi:hypothetical protein
MFGITISLAGLLIIPILLFLAWRGWIGSVRGELRPGRNSTGFVGLLVLSVNWVGPAFLVMTIFLHHDADFLDFRDVTISLARPLDVAAVALAIALRGMPRIYALLAGLLLFVCWPFGYH